MAAKLVIPSIFTAVDKLSNPLSRMQHAVNSFVNTTNGGMLRTQRTFSRFGSSVDAAYNKINPFSKLSFLGFSLGLAGATTLFKKFVDEASKVENAVASFTPLLGGVDQAKKLVADLNKAAAETPFQFETLASSANLLLGFGAAVQGDVIDKMKMLGDVAQGNADKMQGITLAFAQIQAAGKASMQDVNQLINNGVPILGELAKMWGVNAGQAREMVSRGKGTSIEITKAFERMTGAGGMFYNGMSIASKTFTGQMSTLMDNVNMAFAEVGMAAMPVLKQFVQMASSAADKVKLWVTANKELITVKLAEWGEKVKTILIFLRDNFNTIITIVKIYIGTLIALRAASLAMTAATVGMQVATTAYNVVLGISTALQGKSAFYVMGSKVAYAAYRGTVLAATAAQWLLNAAMTANPIGLIIVGIGALIGLTVAIIKHWDSWGETVAAFAGPLGIIINMIQSFRRNWEKIKNAFSEGGIIEGLKMIGKTMLDAILSPLQRILEIAGKLPGAMGGWARNGAANIQAFRNGMGTSEEANAAERPAPVNPRLAERTITQRSINETNNTNKILIELGNAPAGTKVKENNGNVPLKMTSTLGQFGQ